MIPSSEEVVQRVAPLNEKSTYNHRPCPSPRRIEPQVSQKIDGQAPGVRWTGL